MAKKQGPNLLAIQKQMLDAGRDTRMESFMQSAMGVFAVNIAEQEKAEATMQKHMEDLGGVQNIVKLPMEQRGAVEDFLRTNRDEYNTLAEQYEKTKDPAIKDQMNNIKFKFETLNSQLEQFATSKAEYMHDYEEGNLMKGGTFAKDNAFYMGMYGDPKAQFSINETGEMSFTVNGETKAFKDVGGHTLRNYEAEKNIDTLFGTAADLAVTGKHFDKARFAQNFVNGHKSISKNDLQAILQTDLSGDGDKPSFMDQWANGELADEFYKGVDKNNIKEEDIKNLLNDKQRGLDLMGQYVGNISEGIYGNTDLDPQIKLDRDYRSAQTAALNKKSKGEGGKNDLGRPGPKGYRNDKVIREQIDKINNPSDGSIINYGDENYQWNEEEKGWEDSEGNILDPKNLYDIMDLPGDMYNLSNENKQAGSQAMVENNQGELVLTDNGIPNNYFANINQDTAINDLMGKFNFQDKGFSVVKPPAMPFLRGLAGKDDYLVVKGPNGGFIDAETYEEVPNNESLRGKEPLTFRIGDDNSFNDTQADAQKFNKFIEYHKFRTKGNARPKKRN